jgi:putative PIN family toxin of toxin-antitoxin system
MQNEVYILDTNIWISYVLTRRLHVLVANIIDNRLKILTNSNLFEEIEDVLTRPKFRRYIKREDVKEVIALHLKLCHLVITEDKTHNLSDPNDNFLLDLYKTGNATILVSGDKDLLREANNLNYKVMTMRDFELSLSG